MSSVEYSFELNGVPIKTTVVNSFTLDDDRVSSFFRPPHGHQTKIIGFDIEWVWMEANVLENPILTTVHLCDGSSCLVIQLRCLAKNGWKYALNDTCRSLHNFLSLPNYTFVGVGDIKDKLAKLKKNYGICCRSSVELGPLAATLFNMPRLSFCGVDELSFVVNNFDLRDHRPSSIMSFDWSRCPLPKELAKLATINVYSCYEIGCTLLGNKIILD